MDQQGKGRPKTEPSVDREGIGVIHSPRGGLSDIVSECGLSALLKAPSEIEPSGFMYLV